MNEKIEIRPGRRINIDIHKGKGPTLFLIHGLGGRGEQWREQITHWKDKYTLIIPDLLGHGESEKPESKGYNLYAFAELNKDIQAIFERFAGSENSIIGHSYGGALTAFLTLNNQNRIQKMVLLTPLSCQPFHEMPIAYLLPIGLLEWTRGYLDKTFEKLAFGPHASPELLKKEKEGRELNQMHVIKSLLLGMKDIPRLDVTQLSTPTFIITTELDKLVPCSGVKSFYGQLPHHQLIVLKDAGHLVHLEKAKEVNTLLDSFL